MSGKVVGWVFDHPEVRRTPSESLVLLAIGECARSTGEDAWPTLEELARMTGISTRQVVRVIAKLEKRGVLIVERRRRNGHQDRSRYQVVMEVDQMSLCEGVESTDQGDISSTSRVTSDPESRVTSDPPPPAPPLVVNNTGLPDTGINKAYPSGKPAATHESSPLVGEIVPALNPGAVYVEACRLAGYEPLGSDIARVGKAAKQAREQGKPDVLVSQTCEALAFRNLGAPLFGRILAELEAAENGHPQLGRPRNFTHEDSLAFLDAWVAAGDEP